MNTSTERAGSIRSKAAKKTPGNWEIKVRRGQFPVDRNRYYAVRDSRGMSHFLHLFSLMFPAGEKFFVDSVMHFRDRINDEELLRQIRAFAAQESQHSAQHRIYNTRVDRRGIRTKFILKGADIFFATATRRLPPKVRLAATAAAEHFTAILARQVLELGDRTNMDSQHGKLWRWHAVEEIEHKAVAFDTYLQSGGTYRQRVLVMAVMTAGAIPGMLLGITYFMAGDGLLLSAKEWKSLWNYALGEPGVFRRAYKDYLSWYRRDFHPWDQDDSDLVRKWKAAYETELMTPVPV